MPRCNICDTDLPDMRWNKLHQEFDPCPVCLEIIADVFGDEKPDDDETEPTPEELADADNPPPEK